jgi:DNA-binding NarL/FixJ family response regulator
MPRLLVADDHQVTAEGVVRLLQDHWPDTTWTSTIDDTLTALTPGAMDLVVLDVEFRELARSGFDVLRHCARWYPRTRVLLLTAFEDGETARSAKRQGGHGCLGKHEISATLVNAVQTVLGGGEWWGTLLERPDFPPKQHEVLRLVARGLTQKEVALRMGSALITIENQMHSIRERLGVKSTIEAVLEAQRLGLLLPGIMDEAAVRRNHGAGRGRGGGADWHRWTVAAAH